MNSVASPCTLCPEKYIVVYNFTAETKQKTLKKKFHGIIPPVITPLLGPDTLDIAGLERTLERMIKAGVHGLFMLGTTGEAPHLSYRLRKEVIIATQKIVQQRLPVLVGITDSSSSELLSFAQFAEEQGVDALVLAPPFYAPISEKELTKWLEWVVPQLPLPTLLYNMPSHTKTHIPIATVQKMAAYEKVIGIKDSSGNMPYFNMLLAAIDRPDFTFFTGPEILLGETILLGGDGGVSGGANLYPELFVAIYNAAKKGDMDALKKYQAINSAIHLQLYNLSSYGSSFLCSLKAAMSLKGICQNIVAPPYFSFDKAQVAQVKEAMIPLDLLINEIPQ